MGVRIRSVLLGIGAMALAVTAAFPSSAAARSQVKIAFSYPMTGSLATVGHEMRAAVEVAANIINQRHPNLSNIPLAKSAGLPNLGGAKIKPIFIDTQGNPATGQTQLLRFATQKSVAAMMGSYQSAVTKTTSSVAERYGIPFLASDAVEANLTTRGYKWFFRTTPNVSDFAKDYVKFINYLNKIDHAGLKTLAIVHENSSYGSSVSKWVKKAALADGLKVVSLISYNHNTTDVSSEVTKLSNAKPDVVVFASYTSDAILYMKTMKNMDYKPKLVIGDDSGFSDPDFVKDVGSIAQGAIDRSAWTLPSRGPGYIVNQLYHKKTGDNLDGSTARAIQGLLVLADAINRAGSTEHNAIRKALMKTNLGPKELMMPWRGVKFNKDNQNTLGDIVMVQLQGNNYVTVWPHKYAKAKVKFPYTGWK